MIGGRLKHMGLTPDEVMRWTLYGQIVCALVGLLIVFLFRRVWPRGHSDKYLHEIATILHRSR
jgi:hypothetical protein